MATPIVTIKTNAEKLKKALEQIPAKQLPFAKALIATRVAQKVQKAEREVMKARLDRPTAWTLNSLYLQAATKRTPYARVWFKDQAPAGGTAAGEYLQPEVFGGERSQKRSERALITMGLIKRSQYLVPASGAKLDVYGNMKRSQITQIIAQLRGEQGKKRGRDRNAYFFGKVEGSEGVWQKVRSAFGDGVKPVLLVHNGSPRYKRQFPFFDVAENVVEANYESVAVAAINEALSTAKP
jgi:hypothetical protein